MMLKHQFTKLMRHTVIIVSVGMMNACSETSSFQPVNKNKMDVHATQTTASNYQSINKKPYVLIDVRTLEEYEDNGLEQATLIPHNAFGQYADMLNKLTSNDKNTPIKVYCRSGRRAEVAITSLKSMGYHTLENLETRNKAQDYVNKNPIHINSIK